MDNRFNLYAPIHKGIRFALSGLCYQVGSVDCSEEEKVNSFVEEFKRVSIILDAHSRDEDDNINESYEKFAPETLLQLEKEHHELEEKLDQLVERVEMVKLIQNNPVEFQKLWAFIGEALNQFTADYFAHLQTEEGPGMRALWENLSDDELKVISLNIRSAIPPQTMAIFMHYMIPAISHQERLEMFSDMKRFAPKEAYAGMLALAKSRLDSPNWVQLDSALEKVNMN